MAKFATFFGGAINDKTTKEYHDSILIGELLADNDYTVKNGGYRGLMEAVSNGVVNKNGTVYGFTCETFGYTKGNKFLSNTIVAPDIYDRLRYLIEGSDLFIIQRGGIGTLAELFLLLDNIRKIQNKPNIFIFGNELRNLFNNMGDFIPSNLMKNIIFCDDYNQFKEFF